MPASSSRNILMLPDVPVPTRWPALPRPPVWLWLLGVGPALLPPLPYTVLPLMDRWPCPAAAATRGKVLLPPMVAPVLFLLVPDARTGFLPVILLEINPVVDGVVFIGLWLPPATVTLLEVVGGSGSGREYVVYRLVSLLAVPDA